MDLFLIVYRDMVCCREEGPRGFVLNWQHHGQLHYLWRWLNACHCSRQSHHPQVSSLGYWENSLFLYLNTWFVYMLCVGVGVLSHLLNAVILSLIFRFALISLWLPAIGNCVLTWSPPLRKLLIQPSSGWSTGGSHPICRLEVSCKTWTHSKMYRTEPDFLTPTSSWSYMSLTSVTWCCLLDYLLI